MTDIERNKQIVRDFCELAFNAKQPADAAQQFLGPQYIQHKPQAPDGAEAFIGYVTSFVAQAPDLSLEIKRIIAEGDIVVTHAFLKMSNDDARASSPTSSG